MENKLRALLLIGMSHRTTPVEIREKFSFSNKRLPHALDELNRIDSVRGAVILSTCNRTEIYAEAVNAPTAISEIKRHLLDAGNIDRADDISRGLYILNNVEAARHIFRVASGLDSQVLGEVQILGQVRSAWKAARDIGRTTETLDGLFEKALDVGCLVRAETKISQGNVSIGSASLRMLEEKFGDLKAKKILIIGAGKIGVLVSRYLREKGIGGIFVSSRTYEKAKALASNCGGKAVSFSQLNDELKKSDIVISATSSPHIILKKDVLEELMKARERGLVIMDLALPRDVDPAAGDIPGIWLYDLDDLKFVVEENYNKRKEAAKFAEEIIQRELEQFLKPRISLTLN